MELDEFKQMKELREMLGMNDSKSKKYLDFDCLDDFFKSQDFIEIVASANFNHNSFDETKSFISNILYIATSYIETFGKTETASYKDMKETIKKIVVHANENANKLAKLDVDTVIIGMIENKLFKDLNISKKDATKEQIEEVKWRAIDLVNSNSNKYHAFNTKDLDSILQNGIDPNSKDKEVEEDKKNIDEIFVSHNRTDIFPFLRGDKGKVSYSLTSNVSYGYSYTSPEWFSNFCGSDYFLKRSYKDAKAYIKNECVIDGLNKSEEETVLNFFDKYWNMYANQKHMLAIAPNNDNKPFTEEAIDFIKDYDIDGAIGILVRNKASSVDGRSDTAISIKDGSIIELPDTCQIMEKVVAYQNRKQLEN